MKSLIPLALFLVTLGFTAPVEARGAHEGRGKFVEGQFYPGYGYFSKGYFYYNLPADEKRALYYYEAGKIHRTERHYRYPHRYRSPQMFSGYKYRADGGDDHVGPAFHRKRHPRHHYRGF